MITPNCGIAIRCLSCNAYGFVCPKCDSEGCADCQETGVQVQGTGYVCEVKDAVAVSYAVIHVKNGSVPTMGRNRRRVKQVFLPASFPEEAALKFHALLERWPDTVQGKAFQAPDPKQKVLLARMPASYRKLVKTAGEHLASQIPEKLAWALVIGSKDSRFGGYISNANHADTIQALEDALDAIKQQNAGGRN